MFEQNYERSGSDVVPIMASNNISPNGQGSFLFHFFITIRFLNASVECRKPNEFTRMYDLLATQKLPLSVSFLSSGFSTDQLDQTFLCIPMLHHHDHRRVISHLKILVRGGLNGQRSTVNAPNEWEGIKDKVWT